MKDSSIALADRRIQGNEGYLKPQDVARLTPEILLARTTALKPLLAEHAREAEMLRRPVDKVWKELQKTGIFYHFVPKRFGGLELGCEEYIEELLPLAEGDASTAWAAGFCVHHNWLMAHFPMEGQEEMFAKGYGLAPGVVSPPGLATKVDGGYRVRGRWKWGSGVMNSDWIIAACIVEGETAPQDLMQVAMRADEVIVPDNWHMAGMAATGSADIIAEDVFVPLHRAVRASQMRNGTSPGAKIHSAPVYKMPMSLFLGVAAAVPAVGSARGAVSYFREYLYKRIVFGTTDAKYSDKPIAQMRLAEATLKSETATMLMRSVGKDCMAFANAPASDDVRIATRGKTALAVRLCLEAVRTLCEGAGSSAYFLDCPLQRALRDVTVISSHVVFDYDASLELLGRNLLGLPPNSPHF